MIINTYTHSNISKTPITLYTTPLCCQQAEAFADWRLSTSRSWGCCSPSHRLNMHQNSTSDGSHKSRCRQRQVSDAVHANKSSGEQLGTAGVHEGGHDDEILVVIILQVSSQEIKCWYRGRPHLFCLNLTAKSFATSILWCQRDRLIAQRQLRQR